MLYTWVDSKDLRLEFEDGQGRWAKNCDVLYLMVINIDFRWQNDTSPKQWYLQIHKLDVCMSVKHIIVLGKSCKQQKLLLPLNEHILDPSSFHIVMEWSTDVVMNVLLLQDFIWKKINDSKWITALNSVDRWKKVFDNSLDWTSVNSSPFAFLCCTYQGAYAYITFFSNLPLVIWCQHDKHTLEVFWKAYTMSESSSHTL